MTGTAREVVQLIVASGEWVTLVAGLSLRSSRPGVSVAVAKLGER
jgi:hypothetical protein